MECMAGSHSARFSLVAMLAVLLSAGGIAYMASVSYPDELGIVDARRRKHQERAEQIGRGIIEAVVRDVGASEARETTPDGAYFVVRVTGEVLHPTLSPFRSQAESTLEGLLPQRGFQARQRNLERARRIEAQVCGETEPCEASLPKLRQAAALYELAEKANDTGAEALLGLARLHRIAGQGDLAASRYRELRARFGARMNEAGLPYVLLAEIGLAEISKTAGPGLSLLRSILNSSYNAPSALLEVVAEKAITSLDSLPLTGDERGEREALRATMQRVQRSTALGMRLAPRGIELSSTATDTAKGLVAPWDARSTLVYQRGADGRVFGRVLTESEVRSLAVAEGRRLGLHSSLRVTVQNLRSPSVQAESAQQRAQTSLGPLWPHLSLVLWQAGEESDAMGDIAEARRRHRAITGGLIAVLVLGLLATIRGAARERELARLKSD